MDNKPFNRYFWLALAVIVFAGGLMFGLATSLNDEIERTTTASAASLLFSAERIEFRNIDMEIDQLRDESLEADFDEVDRVLQEL